MRVEKRLKLGNNWSKLEFLPEFSLSLLTFTRSPSPSNRTRSFVFAQIGVSGRVDKKLEQTFVLHHVWPSEPGAGPAHRKSLSSFLLRSSPGTERARLPRM
jgi:hypothetical protein